MVADADIIPKNTEMFKPATMFLSALQFGHNLNSFPEYDDLIMDSWRVFEKSEKASCTNNTSRDILRVMLSGDMDEEELECCLKKAFDNKITTSDLPTLSEDDLIQLGYSDELVRKDMLQALSYLPETELAYDHIKSLDVAAYYNVTIVTAVSNELEFLTEVMKVNYEKHKKLIPIDYVLGEKWYSNVFLDNSLSVLLKASAELGKEIQNFENFYKELVDKQEKRTRIKRRKVGWTVGGIIISVLAAFLFCKTTNSFRST